ncbi:MAG: CBS domain-containing protein [Burkholderiales bacterium]|nr:CBS domain-containing protein [Burkholderiales bacterium]
MAERTISDIIEGQELLTAPSSMTVTEAARLMKRRNVGAMMVVDDDKLVGMFTERDGLFRVVAAGLDSGSTPLSAVMTPNPRAISPDRPFEHALGIMHEGRFRHLPVIKDGRPVGMISVRDAFGPELESFIYELLRQEQVSQILA